MYVYTILVQFHKIKIIFGAAGALVVELEHAHVLLLNLLGAIVEWICGMLTSSYGDYHIYSEYRSIRMFDALWCYTKYSALWLLITHSIANIQLFYLKDK